MNTTVKKGRGRPLKHDADKLIGRRISLTKNEWNIVDEFCENNEINLGDLVMVVSETIKKNNHYENQNN